MGVLVCSRQYKIHWNVKKPCLAYIHNGSDCLWGIVLHWILPFLSYRSPSFQEAVADDIVSVDHMSSGGLRNRRGRSRRQEPVPDP